MPFGLGISEVFLVFLVVVTLGIIAGAGYLVVRHFGQSMGGGNISRQELEQVKQDLEHKIEANREREQLPKG